MNSVSKGAIEVPKVKNFLFVFSESFQAIIDANFSVFRRNILKMRNSVKNFATRVSLLSGRLDFPPEADPPPAGNQQLFVGATGFEPAASWSRTKRATRLRYAPTRHQNFRKILMPRRGPAVGGLTSAMRNKMECQLMRCSEALRPNIIQDASSFDKKNITCFVGKAYGDINLH